MAETTRLAGMRSEAGAGLGTPTITAEVPPSAVDDLKLDEGGKLWVYVTPTRITVYPS